MHTVSGQCEIEDRTGQSEDEMNEQWNASKITTWAQEMYKTFGADEPGADIFRGIEATLKQQRDRIKKLESKMTHQAELANGYNGVLEWGNRVAGEYGIAGTQNNFAFIARTLKEQRDRIKELEASRRRIARDAAQTETERNNLRARVKELEKELAECRAMNAALVSQSAGGAGVRMEYKPVIYKDWKDYEKDCQELPLDGWQLFSDHQETETQYQYATWQRPARPESEPFDALA
jgi:hypothetical protein